MTDVAERQRIAAAGTEHVRKVFGFQRGLDQLCALFEDSEKRDRATDRAAA